MGMDQWRFGWKYSVDDEWIMIPMMMMISQSVVWNRIGLDDMVIGLDC